MRSMARTNSPKNFYNRLPGGIIKESAALVAFLEKCDGAGVREIMAEYFGPKWAEFRKFWAQSGEVVDWISFGLAPHNASYLIQWSMKTDPELRARITKDMLDAGILKPEA